MYNHEPENYDCPFCRIIRSFRKAAPASDILCQTEMVTAFLALGRWPKNPFDVLIVPNRHYENIYDLPDELAVPLHQVSRAVALAVKALTGCDGISLRQHNEPAGSQDVWHYHIHLTPRFTDDHFYGTHRIDYPEKERLADAKRLREYIQIN